MQCSVRRRRARTPRSPRRTAGLESLELQGWAVSSECSLTELGVLFHFDVADPVQPLGLDDLPEDSGRPGTRCGRPLAGEERPVAGPRLGGRASSRKRCSELVAPGSGLIGPNPPGDRCPALAFQVVHAHDPFHIAQLPSPAPGCGALEPDDLESPGRSAALIRCPSRFSPRPTGHPWHGIAERYRGAAQSPREPAPTTRARNVKIAAFPSPIYLAENVAPRFLQRR